MRCLLSPVAGARAFNLEGAVITMDDFIRERERVRPGAIHPITASGPQVPVAYRMDGSQLRTVMTGIPQTPLAAGMRRTLDLFAQLASEGGLSG